MLDTHILACSQVCIERPRSEASGNEGKIHQSQKTSHSTSKVGDTQRLCWLVLLFRQCLTLELCLQDSWLTKGFCIDEGCLARFLKCIESGYLDNPYHNRQAQQSPSFCFEAQDSCAPNCSLQTNAFSIGAALPAHESFLSQPL